MDACIDEFNQIFSIQFIKCIVRAHDKQWIDNNKWNKNDTHFTDSFLFSIQLFRVAPKTRWDGDGSITKNRVTNYRQKLLIKIEQENIWRKKKHRKK